MSPERLAELRRYIQGCHNAAADDADTMSELLAEVDRLTAELAVARTSVVLPESGTVYVPKAALDTALGEVSRVMDSYTRQSWRVGELEAELHAARQR